jgi:hypothetical protein
MISSSRHSERSEAKRNAVEESRGVTVEFIPRDPSISLGMRVSVP